MTTRKKKPTPATESAISPPPTVQEQLGEDAVTHLEDLRIVHDDPDLLAQKVSFRLGRSISPSLVTTYLREVPSV